jgi:deazaflavin-dependent oxidoreductase (nitroreductase family)
MKALTIETLALPRRTFDRGQDTNAKERIRPRRGGTPGARTALKLIGTLHRALYRWSDGRLGGRLRGGPVLLLTTTGRTTGRERTWPLSYLSLGDEVVLIASAHGSPSAPAWYRNLRVQPLVRVQQGGTTQTMRASIAQGVERARLWQRFVARYPVADSYQRNADRELPVVLLCPLDGAERSEYAA